MNRAALAAAFTRTILLRRMLRTRSAVGWWQSRQIERLRRHAVASTVFYRDFEDRPFTDFPIVDKSVMMASFAAFNTLGLAAADAWDVVEGRRMLPGYDVGCSTGTSGNRGLYVISEAERFRWLGTILGKTLPDAPWRRHRVAVILPRASSLYETANQSNLLRLLFLDLRDGLPRIAGPIVAFDPTAVVAPPKVLRWLAEQGVAIQPAHVFSGAEILDPPDRAVIEAHFGVILRDIYMATEGLFGVACPGGMVHLTEDAVHFELRPIGADPLLVSPLVTDFSRRTQIMARYRMNDLLLLAAGPCACGSPYQAVAQVVGRQDDVFALRAVDGSEVTITPDILRNAVLDADRGVDDFRVIQTGPRTVELLLPLTVSDMVVDRARRDLMAVCAKAGASVVVTVTHGPISPPVDRKLRRVEVRWKAEA